MPPTLEFSYREVVEFGCYRCGARIEEGTNFCPSCGAPYTPTPRPVADIGIGTRTTRLAGKTGWRGRSVKPQTPTPEADTERAVSPELATKEEPDSVTEIDADAELVLEQEAEDGDLSGLVDHDADEAKEA